MHRMLHLQRPRGGAAAPACMPDSPLTYDEHRQLGQEIQKARQRLLELAKVVQQVYGPHNRSSSAFQKLNEAMERLCAELGCQAVDDCPGKNAGELYR